LHWEKVNNFLRKANLFVKNITKALYGQCFRKLNAHRLASKAAQIMQLIAGNHKAILFGAWKKYVDMMCDQNAMAGIFGEKQLLKRLVRRWKVSRAKKKREYY